MNCFGNSIFISLCYFIFHETALPWLTSKANVHMILLLSLGFSLFLLSTSYIRSYHRILPLSLILSLWANSFIASLTSPDDSTICNSSWAHLLNNQSLLSASRPHLLVFHQAPQTILIYNKTYLFHSGLPVIYFDS